MFMGFGKVIIYYLQQDSPQQPKEQTAPTTESDNTLNNNE